MMHAVVHSVQDIREAILFARKYNLYVTVKSSGHDFIGRSAAMGSFTINLMEMKKMEVMPQKVDRHEYGEIKVETGLTWAEIYKEVSKVKIDNWYIYKLVTQWERKFSTEDKNSCLSTVKPRVK